MKVIVHDDPPELWVGRIGIDLYPLEVMKSGRWSLTLYPHPEGWIRYNGYVPRIGLWPFYRMWHVGPLRVMRWIGNDRD